MIINICMIIHRITSEQFIKILSKLDCEFLVILVGISIILDIPNWINIFFNELDNTVLFNKSIL